ncbi:hypothetical protein ACLB2K_033219 [Fragaria x ananassa]
MKIIRVQEPCGPGMLIPMEVDDPEPQDDEVVIQVMAIAVNTSDVIARKIFYPMFPQSCMGLECSGIIEKAGKNVKDWGIGNKVCAILRASPPVGKISNPGERRTPAQATCATSAEPTTWRTPGGCRDGCAADPRPEEARCTRCRGRRRPGALAAGMGARRRQLREEIWVPKEEIQQPREKREERAAKKEKKERTEKKEKKEKNYGSPKKNL